MGTVYDNVDSWAWLPKSLQNQFVKDGHNRYAMAKKGGPKSGKVKAARAFTKAAVKSAKATGGDVKAVRAAGKAGIKATVQAQRSARFHKANDEVAMTKESPGIKSPKPKPRGALVGYK